MSTVTAGSFELDQWLHRIGHGDRDALGEVYQATGSAVYAYALSILGNHADAQDVVHDTFVSIWHKAEDYRSQGKPLAWIITIARNHCMMLLRRQRRYIYPQMPQADNMHHPQESVALRLCLELLSDEERQIVVLHVIAGMTHRQIGQLLGLKTSTVLSKYHRSLQKLRENL